MGNKVSVCHVIAFYFFSQEMLQLDLFPRAKPQNVNRTWQDNLCNVKPFEAI